MSIGFAPDDFGYVFLLSFAGLLVPIGLLLIGKLIGRIFGVRSGAFQLIFMLVIVGGVIIGGSLYLDQTGRLLNGRVTTKDERVRLQEEGNWQHDFQAGVAYRQDGAPPNPTYLAEGDSSVSLKLGPAQFDQLRKDSAVALKVLPVWRTLTLVRLANTSTREWIPWSWLVIGLGAIVLGWLAFRLRRSQIGCLVVVLLGAIVALGVPTLLVYREWRAAEDLAAKPLRAEATVREVTHITRIDPLPCRRRCGNRTEFDVPQQYDIVQMAFTPQGGRDVVIAVDAVDAGSVAINREGALPIAYAAADPRAAQIMGATHTHHWKNLTGFVGVQLGLLVALVLLLLLLGALGRFFGRLLRGRSQARP
jgi:hypothetical protein